MSDTATLPVTIVTGALGAGKTTLLNRLLTGAHGRKHAVIVNEFGDIGIDAELIEAASDDLIELVNGCVCCQAKDGFSLALRRLLPKAAGLDGIFVETSGLSDPLPLARTFLEDYVVASACRLQAIITVVDASRIGHGDLTPEEYSQIVMADRLIINKADLVDAGMLATVQARLKPLNPAADIHIAERCRDLPEPVRERWNRAALPAAFCAPAPQHQGAVASVSLTLDGEVDGERFLDWAGSLIRGGGMEIVRSKGILALAGQERRFIFQSVETLVDGAPERAWRSGEPRTSRVVFIGRRLDPDRLTAEFNQCAA